MTHLLINKELKYTKHKRYSSNKICWSLFLDGYPSIGFKGKSDG